MDGLRTQVPIKDLILNNAKELLIVSSFMIAAAFYLQQIIVPEVDNRFVLNLEGWKWLAEVKLGVEDTDPHLTDEIDSKIALPKEIQFSLPKQIAKRKHAVRKISPNVLAKEPALGKVGHVDQLILKSAAPLPENKEPNESAESSEKRRLMLVHRFLTVRLFVALNTPAISMAGIQVANQTVSPFVDRSFPSVTHFKSSAEVHSQVNHTAPNRIVSEVHPTPKKKDSKIADPYLHSVLAVRDETANKQESTAARSIASFGAIAYEPAANTVPKQEAQAAVIKSRQDFNPAFHEINGDQDEVAKDESGRVKTVDNLGKELDDQLYSVVASNISASHPEGMDSQNSEGTLADVAQQTAHLNSQNSANPSEYSKDSKTVAQNEYSVGYPTQPLSDYSPQKGETAESIHVVTPPPAAPTEDHSKTVALPEKTVPETEAHQAHQVNLDPTLPVATEAGYVEAFDFYNKKIFDAQTEIVSMESTGEGDAAPGWRLATAPAHGATLFWSDLATNPGEQIPLIAQDKIMNFKVTGVSQQAGAGLIYGKVASGWRIEAVDQIMGPEGTTLGRADPIYIGDENQKTRDFVFLNARPGSGVLYLVSDKGERGGLAFPIIPGVSTYLDLTQVSVHTHVSGVLYDESNEDDSKLWPLAGSTIRAIGQASAKSITDENGRFNISDLITVATYPVFLESYKVIEVEDQTFRHLGYTHRYKVSPKKTEKLELFRIARSEFKGLVKQIPDGMSLNSGMVMAAFTGLGTLEYKPKLVPSIQSWPSSKDFTPVAYPINNEGRLFRSDFIQESASRFLGIQIPEGPVVVKLTDIEKNRVVWAELIYATPNVLDLVGPHAVQAKSFQLEN